MSEANGMKNTAKTPKEGLDYLRQAISDFDERCAHYVEKMLFMGEQRRVLRVGYNKLRFYPTVLDPFLPWDNPVTDADHIFHLVNAVILFKDYFGQFIPWLYGFQPQWLDIVEQVVFHEIGETSIGDLPDDGSRDTAKKDEQEQQVFDEFMVGFPEAAQVKHQKQFAAVRDGTDIGKLFDKQGFLNGIAYLNSHGINGSIFLCTNLSAQDNKYRRLVRTDRCFDLVYADMLVKYRKHPFLPFFMGINEAIYAIVYNKFDPRVPDCDPGKVPPGLQQLYL